MNFLLSLLWFLVQCLVNFYRLFVAIKNLIIAVLQSLLVLAFGIPFFLYSKFVPSSFKTERTNIQTILPTAIQNNIISAEEANQLRYILHYKLQCADYIVSIFTRINNNRPLSVLYTFLAHMYSDDKNPHGFPQDKELALEYFETAISCDDAGFLSYFVYGIYCYQINEEKKAYSLLQIGIEKHRSWLCLFAYITLNPLTVNALASNFTSYSGVSDNIEIENAIKDNGDREE